ncbi:MAG: protoheme IX farnesyltransferase [Actinobacteria bacterium]|uniref:Protoheme IX farnesyltransferase n=1 Tax=freshwater metagenome TaxID=449393 RepID=A0A6J6H0E4_9ZZZZ|nr:protoheme IX farnesyltransferase [Actinomycetota bacterium]MTA24711.1 protoheme IX farnesyltransferase [Actinomycetota bacterium]
MSNSKITPYIALMKLRVVELLLVTTLPALFLAAKGVPPLGLTLATLIGGTLAAGASNAFNMIIEVDSDRLMIRTAKRPIVTGAVTETQAFIFASALTIISLSIFSIYTTLWATVLTAAAIVFYVFGYTIGLKRRTSQNIVWGGIAGCMPVLIGWAAITNSLSLTAWLFFLVIFFWTPPHFWALAIKYRDDYEAAGIPMLPVVASIKSVEKQMWFHTIGMVLASLGVNWSEGLPWWCWVITILIALGFGLELLKIDGPDSNKAAAKLFQWSITYLSVYSLLLVIAALVVNP